MDPRDRADQALARARARRAFIVTPDTAVSPMDAQSTVQIPRPVFPGGGQPHDPDSTQVIDQRAMQSGPPHPGQIPSQPVHPRQPYWPGGQPGPGQPGPAPQAGPPAQQPPVPPPGPAPGGGFGGQPGQHQGSAPQYGPPTGTGTPPFGVARLDPGQQFGPGQPAPPPPPAQR